MFTEGKVYIFRIFNPILHLLPPLHIQWGSGQFIRSVQHLHENFRFGDLCYVVTLLSYNLFLLDDGR